MLEKACRAISFLEDMVGLQFENQDPVVTILEFTLDQPVSEIHSALAVLENADSDS